MPEDKVKENAEGVGNHNGDDCPEHRAHAAAFCVAVDIANDEQVARGSDADEQAQQRAGPWRRTVRMMMSQDYVEEDLCADETDSRQDPGPHGNDLELSRKY